MVGRAGEGSGKRKNARSGMAMDRAMMWRSLCEWVVGQRLVVYENETESWKGRDSICVRWGGNVRK